MGHFRHLHHERGTSPGQIIRRTDTGKNTVYGAQSRVQRRYVAASMGQQADKRGLAHVCALAPHIWTGNYQHAVVISELDTVGHKILPPAVFHHRVAAVFDRYPGG